MFLHETDRLLHELLESTRQNSHLLRENLAEQREQTCLLQRILHAVELHFPTSFHLQEISMVPLAPGQSPQFTATLVPAGSDLGGVVPTWTSSDPANAPVTADATGLVATCALSPAIAVGASVTLTVSATSADGTQTATGSVTFTVIAVVPGFPTSFDVAQSA